MLLWTFWDIINYVILAQGRHQHPLNLPKDLQGPGWSVGLDIGYWTGKQSGLSYESAHPLVLILPVGLWFNRFLREVHEVMGFASELHFWVRVPRESDWTGRPIRWRRFHRRVTGDSARCAGSVGARLCRLVGGDLLIYTGAGGRCCAAFSHLWGNGRKLAVFKKICLDILLIEKNIASIY